MMVETGMAVEQMRVQSPQKGVVAFRTTILLYTDRTRTLNKWPVETKQ